MDKITTHYSPLTIIIFLISVLNTSAQSSDVIRKPEFPTVHTNKFYYQPIAVHDILISVPSQLNYIQLQKIDYQPSLFCKLEYKLESKSKLAPRFRLGSLNYTNWMEGKGELYSRYWK